jgi:PAS domain S-box-containing protein
MGKAGLNLKTAIILAVGMAGFLVLDLILDQWTSGVSSFSLSHVLLSAGMVLLSLSVIGKALETRRQAEDALRKGRDELEMRVQQRTLQLEQSNASLQAEIAERQRAELERARSLEQMNQARQYAENLAAELQQTNGMLHALLDTLPVGLVILDGDGGIVLANPLARSIMGSALTGDAVDENGNPLLFRTDGSAISFADLPLYRALYRGDTTTGMEVQMRRADGSKAFIYIAAGPVCDASGNITGAVKIVQDISDLKRMEQALRESEEKYRTQFDVFTEPSTVWDHNGVLIMQNLVSARNLGGPREAFIGKTAQEIYGAAAGEFMKRHQRVLETGVTESHEDVFETAAGLRYAWVTIQRTHTPDGQFAIQIISYDITERKQVEMALRASEEKFATVFHFSPDAIGIIRLADGLILDANDATMKLLSLSRADLVGRRWPDLLLVPGLRGVDQMVALFREKGRIFDYEMDLEALSRKAVTVLISLIPIQIGGEDCVLVIIHDITTRKRSEEALRQVQAELAMGIQERSTLQERQRLARELHDSVSQALYGISLGAHTALTLINSDRDKVIEAINYVISLAQAGLAEMRALIFELRPESLELEGLVKALLKQSAALRARHGIALELSLCEEPFAPLAIKEAIYRITQEALQNAVKHARSNQITVNLHQESGCLKLEVSDNGIGFNPQAVFPGHLGLRSMRERAANLGGSLEITSTENGGTQVCATIPIPTPVPV